MRLDIFKFKFKIQIQIQIQIRPYALNNIDIRTLCWPQEGINRRIGKKPLAYPGLKTTTSANA